jgi:hypothetical protein
VPWEITTQKEISTAGLTTSNKVDNSNNKLRSVWLVNMFLRFTENAQTKHWNDRARPYSAEAQTENARNIFPVRDHQ